ncbi:MobA/MobL family protein (plasmid) [Thalassospira sp. SM2505]
MAIYHLHQQVISRSAGRSSVFSAAYRAGAHYEDERLGRSQNYSNKSEVLHHEIFAPDNAPEFLQKIAKKNDGQALWNAVEKDEDRRIDLRYRGVESRTAQRLQAKIDLLSDAQQKQFSSVRDREIQFLKQSYDDVVTASNRARVDAISSAQTAFEIEASIPVELSKEQGVSLARKFVMEELVAKGMVADLAVHWKEGNPHFHVMTTMRNLEAGGFGAKNRDWQKKEFLNETRAAWARVANSELQRLGLSARIDHRSYADLGVDVEPTIHEGFRARQIDTRGEVSERVTANRDIARDNASKLAENVSEIGKILDTKYGVWTARHLHNEVFKRFAMDDAQAHSEIVNAVLSHVSTMHIGQGTDGDARYSSTSYITLEKRVFDTADILNKSHKVSINSDALEARIAQGIAPGIPYSDEQKHAIRHMASNSDLVITLGRAGTGKTTVVKPVAAQYQEEGRKVIGMAVAGIAAENLGIEAGIENQTLASYITNRQMLDAAMQRAANAQTPHERKAAQREIHFRQKNVLKTGDVVFFDEAGQVSMRDVDVLLTDAHRAGAKVIKIGDFKQIGSIGAGAPFRAMADRYDVAELLENRRQKIEWQRDAAIQLGEYRTGDGLDAYHKHGRVHFLENRESLIARVADDYIKIDDYNSSMVLAFTNDEVNALNTAIIERLQSRGDIGETVYLESAPSLSLAKDMRVVFMENDRKGWKVSTIEGDRAGVNNGTRGIVESISEQSIVVQTDDGRRVQFTPEQYNELSPAYAVTLHKSQGQTVNKTLVVGSDFMRAAETHVALTRHRLDANIYLSKTEFSEYVEFVKSARRVSDKDMIVDFSISPDRLAAQMRVERFGQIGTQVRAVQERIRHWQRIDSVYGKDHREQIAKAWEQVDELRKEHAQVAKDILDNRRVHDSLINRAGLTSDTLEIVAGRREPRLTEAEAKARDVMISFGKLHRETQELYREMKAATPAVSDHERYTDYQVLQARRNEMAARISLDKDTYRPFLRYTGPKRGGADAGDAQTLPVSWKAIEDQSAAYDRGHKRAEYIKTASGDDRSIAVDLLGYAEANVRANAYLQAVLQDVKSNRLERWSDSQHYNDFTLARSERDMLAASVVERAERHNVDWRSIAGDIDVRSDKIIDAALTHNRQNRVRQFKEAIEAGKLDRAAAVAPALAKDKRAYPLIKDAGIEGRAVYRFAREAERQRTQFNLSDNARVAFNRVREYRAVSGAVGQAFGNRLHETNPEQFRHLEALRDRVAYDINQDPLAHQKWVEAEKVNADKLERHARHHVARENVTAFKTMRTQDPAIADKHGAAITEDLRTHAKHLAENNVPVRAAFDAKQRHEDRTFAKDMSIQERQYYEKARQYVDLRANAGRSWATLVDWAKREKIDIREAPGYKETSKVIRERDQLASEIRPVLQVRPEWKERLRIDDARLDRHSNSHAKRSEKAAQIANQKAEAQKRQKEEKASTRTKQLVQRIEDPALRARVERARQSLEQNKDAVRANSKAEALAKQIREKQKIDSAKRDLTRKPQSNDQKHGPSQKPSRGIKH